MTAAAPIHQPSAAAVERAGMTAFARECARRTGRPLDDWDALFAFSIGQPREFWRTFLDWSGVLAEGEPEPVCVGDAVETARFFPGLRLNYAENLLRTDIAGADHTAIVAATERGDRVRLTRGDLRRRVGRLAASLRELGVQPGDRVVALARNTPEAIVACLAATALGATWSSTAPDLGLDAVLGRFRQLEPTVLFTHLGFVQHGAAKDVRDKVRGLVAALPSLRHVVLLDAPAAGDRAIAESTHALHELEARDDDAFAAGWPRFAFDHPLFILFSSGTTGAPKCIMHGAGGTLVEHLKEQRLHSDFGPADTLYFHTSCGWMMWNWQLSALACGTAIVLYDGSVSFPEPDSLLRLLAAERVTVFGTSPAYLQYLRDAGIVPRETAPLADVRLMQSTGSVLHPQLYEWVRDSIGDVPLHSISGGTDIIGCFVLGSPTRPVWAGESSCVSLALDVRSWADGEARRQGRGELVCVAPFPSRPIGLFNDPDGSRFHDAYFAQHDGMWTHGDLIDLTERGTARILGRTDGTLNVRGVRIGPAEIYQIVQDIPGVVEAMALEQAAPREPGGSRLVLLVVLAAGMVLDRPTTLRIKKELSQRGSAAHVPAVIAQVAELPTTHSGKRSERAARDAMEGREIVNLGALKNPGCLDEIAAHPALQLGGAEALAT